MILRVVLYRPPFLSAVVGGKNASACSDDDGVPFIFDKDRRKRQIEWNGLTLPGKSAVLCSQNGIVSTDREAGQLVSREMDGVERIALRQRILPNPALPACSLSVGRS